MCLDPMTIFTIASTAFSVLGSIKEGQAQSDAYKQQGKAYNQQAAIQTQEAANVRDEAKARAEKIRKLARMQGGEASAALAASGVSVAEGTALVIDKDIRERGEQDAFTELLNGDRSGRNLEAGASINRSSAINARGAAKDAKTASYLSTGASLLSGAGQAYSGWKTSKGAIKPSNESGNASPGIKLTRR